MNDPKHLFINLSFGTALTYVTLYHTSLDEKYVAVGMAGFLFSTFFLNPDIDLYYSKPTQRWGLLKYFIQPYSLMFKHRKLSHSLWFGSLTRIFFLLSASVLLYILFLFVQNMIFDSHSFFKNISESIDSLFESTPDIGYHLMKDYPFYISAALGIFLSDTIHIFTDRIF